MAIVICHPAAEINVPLKLMVFDLIWQTYRHTQCSVVRMNQRNFSSNQPVELSLRITYAIFGANNALSNGICHNSMRNNNDCDDDDTRKW